MYKLEDAVKALLENTPIKQIARRQKISKNTVKKYRNQLESILSEKPWIRNDLKEIMTEFRNYRKKKRYSENHGWLESHEKLVDELALECDNYVRLLQVLQEKGYAGRIYDEISGKEIKAYVFVMVFGFSRDAFYEIVRSQDIQTWCLCHIHAFEHFGGVPGMIIPDNLKSAIIKAAYCDPLPNRSYSDLAKHYGFQIDPCIAGVPEHKGKVESGVKYVKNNFLPLRTFKNFTDANRQLEEWNQTYARVRIHGTTMRKRLV